MQSKQSIVTINESGITLHTGLSSRQFANAKMGQYVTEAGLLVTKTTTGFTTEEFRFTDTKTVQTEKGDEVVLINNATKGETLLSLIENDAPKALQVLETLSSIVEWSIASEVTLPNCGPVGTIAIENGILFLPFELFERSILAQNKDTTSLFYGCWINTALTDIDNWRFTLSAYLYTALTGKKPYSELDREKRSEDYYDTNFLPINLVVNIDPVIAQKINHNLSLTPKAHTSIKPLKTKAKNGSIVYQIRDTDENTEISSCPLPASISAIECEAADQNIQFEQTQFIEKKAKKLQRTRFFRKNKTRISVISIIVIVTCFFSAGIIKSNLSKPTTEGMSPEQVVQTFYNSLNTLDGETLDSCGSSSAIGNYSNMVATLFVSGRMREAYERSTPYLTPSQWISTDKPTELFMFGLTNLSIEQKGISNNNPSKGDTADFSVSFYTVANQGLEVYGVGKTVDTLTLEYGKKYWQIIDLETTTEEIPVDSKQFIEELNIVRTLIKEDSEIEVNEQGVLLAETLRETYPWLPTNQEIEKSVSLIPIYLLSE